MKPKISVLVPAYNVALWLPSCLDSILAQTYQNLEIIVVNDGSTDNTGTILDSYAKKNGRIVAIHQKNAGLVAARETGIAHATGDYVTFVDGFPMNAAGKILKYKMREQAVEMLKLQDANAIVTA